jgi:uncharacterized protein
MWGLDKRTSLNLVQWIPCRHRGKLLLLLAVFVTLSLILSLVGTGGVRSNLPVLFAQTEDPPTPLAGPPVYGPFKGTLTDLLPVKRAQINVRDFDAEARFFNPYPTTSGEWTYGFFLRLPGEAYYQVSIESNGNWFHNMITNNESQQLIGGTSSAINTSEGGSNLLKLMVRGDRGWFYINNQLAATLDLRHSVRLSKAGDVVVFTSGPLRGETRVEGFTVRAKAKVVPMGDAPVHGPVNEALAHEGDGQNVVERAQINVRDFDAEARFFNPYPTTSGDWTYGFQFGQFSVEGTLITASINNKLTSIDTSGGGSNLLKLMVRGDTAWLYVNNQFVGAFDLREIGQVGAVFEGDVGVFASGSLRGETRVEGFTVRAEAKLAPVGGPPVAGPVNGTLLHDEDGQFEWSSAGMNVQDFDAEARFFNPYPTTRGSWNYGFAFRGSVEGTFYMVLVDSDKQWRYDLQHILDPLNQGTSSAIDTSEGGSNLLKLMVRGDRGWFYINNQLAATLDLSQLGQAGDVHIVTGYIAGAELPGEATRYRSFTVWGKETVSEADFRNFENDIGDFWLKYFTDKAVRYIPPTIRLHETVVNTPCGLVAEDNAFYCPNDHTIHVLREFLQQQFLPTGDFAVGFVLAHEWAHAAQQQLGFLGEPPEFVGPYWTIQTELQADCLAGVYTDYALFEGDFITIEPGDIQEAAISAELIGTDLPQEHPDAHGSSLQRVDAFYNGFNRGFAACWEYTSVPGVLP